MTNAILCHRFRGSGSPFSASAKTFGSACIDHYWDGREVGLDLATPVHCVWDEENLYFQFLAPFVDLCVNEDWARDESAPGLWGHDVLEVFLRPPLSDAYFEFEVSPLGQWLDAMVREPRKDVDFSWQSGMKVRCEIDSLCSLWTARLVIPFKPMMVAARLDIQPEAGDVWRINLFRISGAGPSRDYLVWQPTFTPQPDFHVPEAFGNLILLD
ncbi:MAG: carbohydrate-binding family 9-like protein [Acidobacteria bacterium]|nr:carbohydrate-binding family 9-like protein [Acidobacteriota bacterium]